MVRICKSCWLFRNVLISCVVLLRDFGLCFLFVWFGFFKMYLVKYGVVDFVCDVSGLRRLRVVCVWLMSDGRLWIGDVLIVFFIMVIIVLFV